MNYSLEQGLLILEKTPGVLHAMLGGLPDEWIRAKDGPDTWSAFDVVGHLVQGERTDWIPRVRHVLEKGDTAPFPPFNREGMFTASAGKSLEELLAEFDALREANLDTLRGMKLTPADLARRGLHPELGSVTLGQHLATWTAHDLGHLRQIAQTMGRQYREAVGPWRAYLSMM